MSGVWQQQAVPDNSVHAFAAGNTGLDGVLLAALQCVVAGRQFGRVFFYVEPARALQVGQAIGRKDAVRQPVSLPQLAKRHVVLPLGRPVWLLVRLALPSEHLTCRKRSTRLAPDTEVVGWFLYPTEVFINPTTATAAATFAQLDEAAPAFHAKTPKRPQPGWLRRQVAGPVPAPDRFRAVVRHRIHRLSKHANTSRSMNCGLLGRSIDRL